MKSDAVIWGFLLFFLLEKGKASCFWFLAFKSCAYLLALYFRAKFSKVNKKFLETCFSLSGTRILKAFLKSRQWYRKSLIFINKIIIKLSLREVK